MFEFEYQDKAVQDAIENREQRLPVEVQAELDLYLTALRRDGVVPKSDLFAGGTGNRGIIRISANTFELSYTGGSRCEALKILTLKVKSLRLLRDRFSIEDGWDDKQLPCIPQCDNPEKLIRAVQTIHSGIDDSYQLGWALDHRGTKDEHIVRHGNYAKGALEQLKLITRIQEGKRLRSFLTSEGLEIAQAQYVHMKKQLLTKAMLQYKPVWTVITAVTEGNEQLDDATIVKLIFPKVMQGADTCPRRARTLRSWVIWISSYTGIPIQQGAGKQLLLPIQPPYADD